MCTTEQTFAWVGALVVNIAFIAIVAWGASTKWWVGFLISIVYTIILFVLARTIDKRSGWDIVPVATSANVNDNNSTAEVSSDESAARHDETQNNVVVAAVPIAADHPEQSTMLTHRSTATSERRMPVLANLLYGLFNIALGVTGYFLPINLFSCYGFGPYYYSPSSTGHWSTDISTLPSGVQTWASSSESNHQMSYATFAHILSGEGGQNSTLFRGSDGSGNYQTLWSTSNGGEPLDFPNIQNPEQFVSTGTDWACFTGINAEEDSPGSLVGCSDGTTVATTADSAQYSFQSPYDLFIDSNTLWFKDYPPWSGYQSGTGTIIYSVDSYEDMTVELHSTYTQSKSEQNVEVYLSEVVENDDDSCWTKHSTLALFISALPITLSSILLWLKRKAPSSAITSYVGISAVVYCLYLLTIDETNDVNLFWFWKWWLPVSGSLYLAILCDLTHCKRNIARYPLIWGINFSALLFFVGMIILSGIFDTSVAWTWIVFNLVGVIPLIVVGIGYNQVFLLVLCAIGWLMTAFKIASAITTAAASTAANVPIYFVVFAICGLLIAGAGWWLNKNQDKFGSVIHDRMKRLSLSRKLFSDVNVDVAITADEPTNDETQGVESA